MDYQRTRASLAAGGLAYFVALSVAPAALAFGTLAGLFLDPVDVRDALERLAGRAPESVGNMQPVIDALVSTVESASASAFTITTVVGAVIAIYASSKVVLGLRMAMNTIFGVVETRGGLIERAISAIVTLVGLIAAVAIVVVLTLLPRVLDWLGVTHVPLTTGSWLVDWVFVVGIVYLAVRWVLHHAPNQARRVAWTSRGAIAGTLGITAATIGVGIYARFSTSLSAAVLVFGTAVVILLWLYLCFVALLWGAIIEADDQRAADAADGLRTRTSAEDPTPGR
jgi:membrane protein